MRQLQINKSRPPEELREQANQFERLLLLWASFGATGLIPEASALQPLIDGNARFVASLARQYQNRGVSTEALVTAAHMALITVLNQYAHRQDKLDKVLALTLRNAMLELIQARAGGSL